MKTQVPANFKLVFLCVFGLTIACLIGLAVIAALGSSATTENAIPIGQRNFQAACSFGWQAGLGAMLGLLGGKATK